MKIPPNKPDSEKAILGALMQRNELFFEIPMPEADDFYHQGNKTIFKAICGLFGKNVAVDIVTVLSELENQKKLDECGGAVYIAGLTDFLTAGVEYHVEQVKSAAVARKMISIGQTLCDRGFDGFESCDLVEFAEREIFGLNTKEKENGFVSADTLAIDTLGMINYRSQNRDTVTGITTGLCDLDAKLCGLQPTDLCILAARPGMGKTALAMNIAVSAAMVGEGVAVFSLEMSKEQLMQRMITSVAGVDAGRVRSGYLEHEDMGRIESAVSRIKPLNIHIDDTPAISTMYIRKAVRKLMMRNNVGLIVIDYLQFMTGQGENKNHEIGGITRDVKAIAKEFGISTLLLSQLNRSLESRADKRPMLADLRDSGSIEQDADVIMFIYRDDYYNKKPDNPKKGIADIIIAKQRNGPTGTVEAAWHDKTTTFKDLAKPWREREEHYANR